MDHEASSAAARREQLPNDDSFRDRVIEALPKLDEMAQAGIHAGEAPGVAIAVVLHDKVVYAKGFGVRKAGENAPVGPDTVFQLASMSKPLASTVVAALVSDGAVSWDTRIADADPGFRLHDAYPSVEVTIRSNHSVWLRPARATPTSFATATGRPCTSGLRRTGKRSLQRMLTHGRPPGQHHRP